MGRQARERRYANSVPLRLERTTMKCVNRIVAVAIVSSIAVAAPQNVQDLTQVSLEDLMNIQVTSVSKKEQKLSKTGAPVFVITQEDIRRSGMTNVPDLLRMVPGVNVARITSNTWAISIRGFNSRYSTKVLVLIDGRSVYTPSFSGVHWDHQLLPLEDIERIEVVRGPGGTVWGANAVNGVISIITKSARDTQGGLLTAATGNVESARGTLRYGGKAGSKGNYRVYGQYYNVENSVLGNGSDAVDGWNAVQGGFRSDWDLSPRDTLTVQGDLLQRKAGQTITSVLTNQFFQTRTFNDNLTAGSGNVLGRWNHTFSSGSQTTLQTYYSRFARFDQAQTDEDMADFDFQYHFRLGSRHDLVAGAGYRFNSLNYRGLYNFRYNPEYLKANLFNTFVQDEMKLSNAVTLTVGSKFEHNAFTGFEFEPSAQVVWSPSDRKALWFSVARAIRQPSWFDQNSELDAAAFPIGGGGLGVLHFVGNPNSQAEKLVNFGAGYRTQVGQRVSLDATVFLSRYQALQTLEMEAPYFTMSPAPPHLVLPGHWDNNGYARNYGFEVFTNWSVTNWWRISPGFTLLRSKLGRNSSSTSQTQELSDADTPLHQAQVRSTVSLPHRIEWDTAAYYTGELRNGPIPSYTRVDTRIGWRAGEYTEFSIAGQNLLLPRRLEINNPFQDHSTQTQRSIVGKITWRF